MKINIYGGEAFPVYSIQRHHEPTNYPILEVSTEVLKRWKSAFDTFSTVQEEIVKQLEEQGHGNQV